MHCVQRGSDRGKIRNADIILPKRKDGNAVYRGEKGKGNFENKVREENLNSS